MELMEAVPLGTIFLSEVVGTAMLLLLGGGVVANTLLKKTKGNGTGFLFVNWGWGLAVMMGVLVSAKSKAHLNPAVTLGFAVTGDKGLFGDNEISFMTILVYIAAQFVGAMIGAALCWLTYKQHFDDEENPALKLAVFSTAPEIRNPIWNTITEIIGTFVLVFVILGAIKYTPEGAVGMAWLGALGVGLLVVSIGISLGGPTGYAINPARDLGPRIMHAILPIKGKGGSDWGYAWVPVVGPIIGGILGGVCAGFLLA